MGKMEGKEQQAVSGEAAVLFLLLQDPDRTQNDSDHRFPQQLRTLEDALH